MAMTTEEGGKEEAGTRQEGAAALKTALGAVGPSLGVRAEDMLRTTPTALVAGDAKVLSATMRLLFGEDDQARAGALCLLKSLPDATLATAPDFQAESVLMPQIGNGGTYHRWLQTQVAKANLQALKVWQVKYTQHT